MAAVQEKILVRGLNWLGDAVMSTPALQRLREARPNAQILLLTPQKLAGLWEGQPFIDGTIPVAPHETVFAIGKKLRAENFTEAVAFPNSFRAALELWLARAPRRVGLAIRGRGLFLTDRLHPRPGAMPMRKLSNGEIHQAIARDLPPRVYPVSAHHAHDYLYLTSHLGASSEPLPPRIDVSPARLAEVAQQFRLNTDRPWFGLNAGAEYGPAKRWPEKRFASTAVILQKQTNCRWLVFGGAADAPLAERITTEIRFGVNTLDAALNLAGKTTLPQLAAALKLCSLLLTNDTGPMHLAAAVGTPVIVPFGSTSPELTGPIFSPKSQILRNPVPCSPCFRRECPIDLRCLNGISIANAVEAARQL